MFSACRPLLCSSSGVGSLSNLLIVSAQRYAATIAPNKPDLKPREEMEKELMFIYETPDQLKTPVVQDPNSLVDRGAQTLFSKHDVLTFKQACSWSSAATMKTEENLPDFWELHEPKIEDRTLFPTYEKLNISLSGYDYPLVQKYQGYVCRICKNLDITVNDTFAMPTRTWKTQAFKRGSVAVQAEFDLARYERVVQITDVSSVVLPILIDLLNSNQPESVQVNVKEFNQSEDDARYVPNTELRLLQEELDSFEIKSVRKKLGFIVDLPSAGSGVQ